MIKFNQVLLGFTGFYWRTKRANDRRDKGTKKTNKTAAHFVTIVGLLVSTADNLFLPIFLKYPSQKSILIGLEWVFTVFQDDSSSIASFSLAIKASLRAITKLEKQTVSRLARIDTVSTGFIRKFLWKRRLLSHRERGGSAKGSTTTTTTITWTNKRLWALSLSLSLSLVWFEKRRHAIGRWWNGAYQVTNRTGLVRTGRTTRDLFVGRNSQKRKTKQRNETFQLRLYGYTSMLLERKKNFGKTVALTALLARWRWQRGRRGRRTWCRVSDSLARWRYWSGGAAGPPEAANVIAVFHLDSGRDPETPSANGETQ